LLRLLAVLTVEHREALPAHLAAYQLVGQYQCVLFFSSGVLPKAPFFCRTSVSGPSGAVAASYKRRHRAASRTDCIKFRRLSRLDPRYS
jgi:hypothetical protein